MSAGWSSEWLEFARMDLSAAEYLLTMHPLPIEIICYHCEQAAEKFLKATLVQFDREPPKTHDLIQLCKLCCEIDAQFEQMIHGTAFEKTGFHVSKLKKCRTKAVLNRLPCPAFRLIKRELPQNLNRICQQRRCRHLAADRCHRLQSPRQETAR